MTDHPQNTLPSDFIPTITYDIGDFSATLTLSQAARFRELLNLKLAKPPKEPKAPRAPRTRSTPPERGHEILFRDIQSYLRENNIQHTEITSEALLLEMRKWRPNQYRDFTNRSFGRTLGVIAANDLHNVYVFKLRRQGAAHKGTFLWSIHQKQTTEEAAAEAAAAAVVAPSPHLMSDEEADAAWDACDSNPNTPSFK